MPLVVGIAETFDDLRARRREPAARGRVRSERDRRRGRSPTSSGRTGQLFSSLRSIGSIDAAAARRGAKNSEKPSFFARQLLDWCCFMGRPATRLAAVSRHGPERGHRCRCRCRRRARRGSRRTIGRLPSSEFQSSGLATRSPSRSRPVTSSAATGGSFPFSRRCFLSPTECAICRHFGKQAFQRDARAAGNAEGTRDFAFSGFCPAPN